MFTDKFISTYLSIVCKSKSGYKHSLSWSQLHMFWWVDYCTTTWLLWFDIFYVTGFGYTFSWNLFSNVDSWSFAETFLLLRTAAWAESEQLQTWWWTCLRCWKSTCQCRILISEFGLSFFAEFNLSILTSSSHIVHPLHFPGGFPT